MLLIALRELSITVTIKTSVMKKKLTGLFAAIILFASASFANDGTQPSAQLQKEFNRIFAQSSEAKWEKVSDLYKVSFVQGGQYLTVYFSPLNRIESVSRNISTSTLPLILQKEIHDKLSNSSWITECFEIFGKNGTQYYATLENANEKTIYHSSGADWVVYKRIAK